MHCVDTLNESDLRGKRVLLRSDFNVPFTETGEVADVFRLKSGWRTVQYLAERGAQVIVVSHLGKSEQTLEPVSRALKHYGSVIFIPDILGPAAQSAIAAMKDGEVVLLENLRKDPGEKANDEAFARALAALADIYVDDAFAAAHRAHASIVGVPKFLPHFAGLLMRDEVAHLKVARTPESPSIAILGGAKFETKAPLIQLLLERYNHVFVAGALANDVLKAQGYEVGTSLISKELPIKEVLMHPHFIPPADVTVERPDKQAMVKKPADVQKEDCIMDIGPDSVANIAPFIAEAKYILWNGPTGFYERGFVHYTHQVAQLIAGAVAKGAQSAIGGGDTIAAIAESGIGEDKLGFLSTGGGAMLEYLLKGTLPGIEALQ